MYVHKVYKIKCQTCNEIYIGKTERILARRIKEHSGKNSESAITLSQRRKSRTHNRRLRHRNNR